MSAYLVPSIIAIVVYSAFCLYIGIRKGYDKTAVSKSRGYFIGNGTPYFILFFTTVASWFSTWIFMGAPGSFYKNGVGWVAGMTWQVIILVLMGYFGPKFWRIGRDRGYITPADMMDDFYESRPLRFSVSISQIVFAVPNLLAQVVGVGSAMSILTGGLLPVWAGCLYAALLVGVYVYFGGFKSQAWVDTAQVFMFVIILWGSVFIMLRNPAVGGMQQMFHVLETANDNVMQFFTDNSHFWTWKMYVSFFIAQAFGGMFAPYVVQRMYAAKDGKTIVKMAGTLAPFYTLVLLLPAMLIGFAGRAMGVDVANADNILVTVMSTYSPLFCILVVIGILAAGMSTISSLLVTSTSIISIDIVKTLKKNIDDKTLRNIGRFTTVAMLVLSVLYSRMSIPGIATLMNMSMAGFSQAFWPSLGLFWKRGSKQGAFWGYTVGVILVAVLYFGGINFLGFTGGFWGFIVNGIIFTTVSLCTKPVGQAHRAETLGNIAAE